MNENRLIDRFFISWQSINRHLRRGTLTEGTEPITRLQWVLLRHVRMHKEESMGSLAKKFGVRPSTVSQMTDRLEKAGLVVRVTDEDDARMRLLHLTPTGEKLINNVEAKWSQRLEIGLQQFSKEELELFLHYLERLASSLANQEK